MLLAALAALTVYAGLPADLDKAAHDYDQAQIKVDRPALDRLIADDFVLQNSGGHAQDKASFIADQVAPGYSLKPFTVEKPWHRVMGDTALLGGVATLNGTDGGQAYSVRLRFVDVWVKRNGRWVVALAQTTRTTD